jgi:tetratricopeptide (TPR) repeat protein
VGHDGFVFAETDEIGTLPGPGFFFVSYARADGGYVAELVGFLRERGIATWRDVQTPPGAQWPLSLRSRIETCAGVVLVISEAADRAQWVEMEIAHAKRVGKPIFPVWLSGKLHREVKDIFQADDVRGGMMPSAAFVEHIRRTMADRVELRFASGVVPEPADCFQLRPVAGDLETELGSGGMVILMGGSAKILTGSGGVGKTQLAAAVARRARNNAEVAILLWITATSQTSILTAYAAAGVAMANANADDVPAAAIRFLEYLGTLSHRWLIVFDDLTDPRDLDGWWPPRTPVGRIIVTTRRTDSALGRHGVVVPVDLFTAAEARRFLVEKFAGHPEQAVGSDELATDLGLLPLALAQAAAYILDRDISCADYRTRFADRTLTLHELTPDALPDDYASPLAVTLSLGVDAANSLRPRGIAGPLLVALSLLDPNGIPAALVETPPLVEYLRRHRKPAPSDAASTSAVDARDGLAALARLSLATGTTDQVRVHALVQRRIREQADQSILTDAVHADADGLARLWPEIDRAETSQTLRDNTATLRGHRDPDLFEPDAHPLLFRVGRSLNDLGLVSQAIDYWNDIIARCTDVAGADHPGTLSARNNLAVARESAGQLDRAIPLYEAVLSDRIRILGPDHPDTLSSRNNLASAYRSAGQLDRAIAGFEGTLSDRVRILGSDHPHTLSSRTHLASAYETAGQLDRAIPLYETTLTDRIRTLGPDHPETLAARNNLANAYHSAGQLDRAIPLYQTTLADRIRILGPDHPDTLGSRNNLGYAYAGAGRMDRAIPLIEATLADRIRILGPDHPHTLASRNNLASAYESVGQLDRAIPLYEATLADRIRILGPDHPLTLSSRNNLAGAYESAGRITEAIALFEATLADRIRILGPNHPHTLSSRNNLAGAYESVGELDRAIAIFEATLADRIRILGPDHPHTLSSRINLARAHESAGHQPT